ncbi:MAG TPA: DUF2239 family protein [Lacipirellulaceae bacterium]|nr:DUF2239 family protein [Lacipirellulaceae bacterium]
MLSDFHQGNIDSEFYPGIIISMQRSPKTCVAFLGTRRIASGNLSEVAVRAKKALEKAEPADQLLIFDDLTAKPIEVDLRGSTEDVVARVERAQRLAQTETVEKERQGPGRPKLGVIGREVTLLPRHWEWLDSQPGGASVTLRKLVEEAKRANAGKDRFRTAQEATYRFMRDMAGDWPGYEEANRVMFSSQKGRLRQFQALVEGWPKDVRAHILTLFKRTLELEKGQSKAEQKEPK